MGFRTVVVLSNDLAHAWQKDPELGNMIWSAASFPTPADFQYGTIVEQVHADTQTLAVLDGYVGRPVAHTFWNREQKSGDQDLALLKELADKMGYRLSKKAVK